jgi:uncharacterized membrane protein
MDEMLFPKTGFILAASSAIRHVLIRGSILLVVVAILGLVISRIRRWRTAELDTSREAWTLQDLRDLHAAGELTDEEFEQLKEGMIATVKGASSDAEPQHPPADEPTG